jgi:hypothetical protein
MKSSICVLKVLVLCLAAALLWPLSATVLHRFTPEDGVGPTGPLASAPTQWRSNEEIRL